MRIIGLCGAAGSGKGEVAKILRLRWGLIELAFADPLYAAVSQITGLSVDQLKDRSIKDSAIPAIGVSPRHLLQTLGTEWGRSIHPDIWVIRTMRYIDEVRGVVRSGFVITDVRFDNEARAIREQGGAVWEVERPDYSCLDSRAAAHPSEAGIDRGLIDYTITNNATLSTLELRVLSAWDCMTIDDILTKRGA